MNPRGYPGGWNDWQSRGEGCGCLLAIITVLTIAALVLELVFGVDVSLPIAGN